MHFQTVEKHTVNWRQKPVLSVLLHTGKAEDCRKSWKIEAYVEETLDTFGQFTGSSIAVIPSLQSHGNLIPISNYTRLLLHMKQGKRW